MMGDIYDEILASIGEAEPIRAQESSPEPAPAQNSSETEEVELNLLNHMVLYDFKREYVSGETDNLTEPVGTIITIDAFVDGVTCKDVDIVKKLQPNEHVVRFRSNHSDDIVYAGYTPPADQPKTNRGRKKKPRAGKQRKRQGNGKNFNNQITFETRMRDHIYKFKVFNTGRIQLPGVTQANIDEVIVAADHVVRKLREATPCGELLYLRPVLKNYRFVIKKGASKLIDMPTFYQIFNDDRDTPDKSAPEHPVLYSVAFSRKKQKITVVFHTPIPGNRYKQTTLIITERGKVNILGGLYIKTTREIFEYLDWIIRTRHDRIIIFAPSARPLSERADVAAVDHYQPATAESQLERHLSWFEQSQGEKIHQLAAELIGRR